jgi:hypothetical protein
MFGIPFSQFNPTTCLCLSQDGTQISISKWFFFCVHWFEVTGDGCVQQFQIRRFLEIDQSKTGIACGSHVCIWIKTKWVTALPKWIDIWWEAPMEGSVLNFLKAEWKVSDTGSAQWASSFYHVCIWIKTKWVISIEDLP